MAVQPMRLERLQIALKYKPGLRVTCYYFLSVSTFIFCSGETSDQFYLVLLSINVLFLLLKDPVFCAPTLSGCLKPNLFILLLSSVKRLEKQSSWDFCWRFFCPVKHCFLSISSPLAPEGSPLFQCGHSFLSFPLSV